MYTVFNERVWGLAKRGWQIFRPSAPIPSSNGWDMSRSHRPVIPGDSVHVMPAINRDVLQYP